MNKHQLHSTDIDREQAEVNDPAFTKYFRNNLYLAVGIGFILSLGSITIAVHYGEKIDAFMNTRAGALSIICTFGAIGTTWICWRIKNMF